MGYSGPCCFKNHAYGMSCKDKWVTSGRSCSHCLKYRTGFQSRSVCDRSTPSAGTLANTALAYLCSAQPPTLLSCSWNRPPTTKASKRPDSATSRSDLKRDDADSVCGSDVAVSVVVVLLFLFVVLGGGFLIFFLPTSFRLDIAPPPLLWLPGRAAVRNAATDAAPTPTSEHTSILGCIQNRA